VVSDCSIPSPYVVQDQYKFRNKIEGTAAVKRLLTRVRTPVAESVNAECSAAWRGWHEQCQCHQIQTSFKIWDSLCSAKRLLAQSTVSNKVRGQGQGQFLANFSAQALFVCCVSLCRCLHLNQRFAVCTSLTSVTGQLVKTSRV